MWEAKAEPLVSIVVPVYNAQDYLTKCLDSLISQSYRRIEIIVVDDGSTDGCAAICDEYQRLDERIRIVHQANGGLSAARNTGIDAAVGDYLTFVDSDDYVSKEYVRRLPEALTENDADISVCEFNAFFINESGGETYLSGGESEKGEQVFTADEALKKMLYQELFDTEACAKVFRRELFDSIRFPLGLFNEDLAVVYRLFLKARKACFVKERLYYYLQRSNSIMGSMSNLKRFYDSVEIVKTLSEEISVHRPCLTDAVNSRALSVYFQSYAGADLCGDPELKRECWEKIIGLRRSVLADPEGRPKARAAALISYFGQSAFIKLYDRFVRGNK